jgi:protein SCO1/2
MERQMRRALSHGAAFLAALGLAPLPAFAHGHAAGATPAVFDQAKALEESQAAIGRPVADHVFRDISGARVKLSAYRGRPVVLSLVYTSCEHTCPLVLESVAHALEAADGKLDPRSYAVLTVGFDTQVDTPARMRAYRSGRGFVRPGWDFLSADPATIERLTAETGFYKTPRAGGFDHLAQVTILDGEGRVYRQVYGESFAAAALLEPLEQLLHDRREGSSVAASMLDRVRLLCTVYDPASGRYRFSYAIFFEIAVGVVSLASVLVFAIRLWRQAKEA